MGKASIPGPTIKLGRILELLTPQPVNAQVGRGEIFEVGKVSPKLFQLDNREDVFVTQSPAPFYILDGDICRHSRSKVPYGPAQYSPIPRQNRFSV